MVEYTNKAYISYRNQLKISYRAFYSSLKNQMNFGWRKASQRHQDASRTHLKMLARFLKNSLKNEMMQALLLCGLMKVLSIQLFFLSIHGCKRVERLKE